MHRCMNRARKEKRSKPRYSDGYADHARRRCLDVCFWILKSNLAVHRTAINHELGSVTELAKRCGDRILIIIQPKVTEKRNQGRQKER